MSGERNLKLLNPKMHIGIKYFDAKNGQIEEALKEIGILGWIRQAILS
jgi:hypothetical protein